MSKIDNSFSNYAATMQTLTENNRSTNTLKKWNARNAYSYSLKSAGGSQTNWENTSIAK